MVLNLASPGSGGTEPPARHQGPPALGAAAAPSPLWRARGASGGTSTARAFERVPVNVSSARPLIGSGHGPRLSINSRQLGLPWRHREAKAILERKGVLRGFGQ